MRVRLAELAAGVARRRADATSWVLTAGLLVGLAVVMGRVVQLQAAPGERLAPFVQERVSRVEEPARRGDLLDRRGRLVAGSREGWRLFVDPTRFEEPFGEKLAAIAGVTGVPVEEVAERVIGAVAENERRAREGEAPRRYAAVGGVLSDGQLARARRLGIGGVHFERRLVRETAAGAAAASLVGKVGFEGRGLLGAELAFDELLRQQEGSIEYVRDHRGRPLWVEPERYEPGADGSAVRLSIDLAIQEIAVEEVRRGVERCDAAAGRAVVVDPTTGEVLALVDVRREVPGVRAFSPEAFRAAQRAGERVRWRVVAADERREVHPALGRNRCVEDVYEPGSTFKPFVWASLVERGLVSVGEELDGHEGLWSTPYGRRLEDVTPMGELTWSEVLVHSSNIGMAQGAARYEGRAGARAMRADVRRFGFGEPTYLGLPGEASGIMTSERNWGEHTKTSVSMGYEVAVTPVQMARAFCVFAGGRGSGDGFGDRGGDRGGDGGGEGGVLPRLRLTAAGEPGPAGAAGSGRTGGSIVSAPVVLSGGTVAAARAAMAQVAARMVERYERRYPEDGPVRYELFGKSGTSEVSKPGGRGYLRRQYTSSFVAGAPVESPRVVVLVVIDDPGPGLRAERLHYGSATAGPVVARIVDRVLGYLGEG